MVGVDLRPLRLCWDLYIKNQDGESGSQPVKGTKSRDMTPLSQNVCVRTMQLSQQPKASASRRRGSSMLGYSPWIRAFTAH
jgi:hypothetical protein